MHHQAVGADHEALVRVDEADVQEGLVRTGIEVALRLLEQLAVRIARVGRGGAPLHVLEHQRVDLAPVEQAPPPETAVVRAEHDAVVACRIAHFRIDETHGGEVGADRDLRLRPAPAMILGEHDMAALSHGDEAAACPCDAVIRRWSASALARAGRSSTSLAPAPAAAMAPSAASSRCLRCTVVSAQRTPAPASASAVHAVADSGSIILHADVIRANQAVDVVGPLLKSWNDCVDAFGAGSVVQGDVCRKPERNSAPRASYWSDATAAHESSSM